MGPLGIGEDSIVPGQKYEVTVAMASSYNGAVDVAAGAIKVLPGVKSFGFREIKPGSDEEFFTYWDRTGRVFDGPTGTGFIGSDDKKYFDDLNKPREFKAAKKKAKPVKDTSTSVTKGDGILVRIGRKIWGIE